MATIGDGLWRVPEPGTRPERVSHRSLDGAKNAPPTRPTRHPLVKEKEERRKATTMASLNQEADREP